MAGHSRPKDGVLSHAYDPAISLSKVGLCHIYRYYRAARVPVTTNVLS
jgi:hypothetical protein